MKRIMKFYLIEADLSNIDEVEYNISHFLCADRSVDHVAMCQLENKKILTCVSYCCKGL